MKRLLLLSLVGAAAGGSAMGQVAAGDGPGFSAANELIRPQDFREWVYVSSGLGMTYGAVAPGRPQSFTNVFVNPSSYRAFMQTGAWPDKTIFILEIRASASEVSINRAGHFQAGLVAIEAAVKDVARFPGKWGYYDFGGAAALKDKAEALPTTASCYACHSAKAAVEQTFVQFYPTLFEVAQRMGTVRPSYTPRSPSP